MVSGWVWLHRPIAVHMRDSTRSIAYPGGCLQVRSSSLTQPTPQGEGPEKSLSECPCPVSLGIESFFNLLIK